MGVTSYECAKQFDPNNVRSFQPEFDNVDSPPKRVPSERASQEEQNGADFSSVAPFSEERI